MKAARAFVAALALAFLLAAVPAGAAELRGVVVGVADGDTITVLDGDKKLHFSFSPQH